MVGIFFFLRTIERAQLCDTKWLGGLDGKNDTGAFLVTADYCQDTAKFNLIVYKWADHVPGVGNWLTELNRFMITENRTETGITKQFFLRLLRYMYDVLVWPIDQIHALTSQI